MKNGRQVWRVNDEHGPEGRRTRRYFADEASAKAYAKNRTEIVRQFGTRCRAFTPAEQRHIGFQFERLHSRGWTLESAVDLACRTTVRPPTAPLAQVVEAFLRAKETEGLRPRSLRKLRATLMLFLVGRRDTPISNLRPDDIRAFLTKNGWALSTMKSYLVDIRTLFAFAVSEDYLEKSPAARIPLPRLDDKPPGILNPAQCRKLMAAARMATPALVPYLALCLFAGIRPEEAQRLEWSDIGNHIEVKAHKAKTRRRRLVEVSTQLRAWLNLGGELPVRGLAHKFNHVRCLAGVLGNWPQDAMRHSFASFHLAKFQDENALAVMMGNSPQVVISHYRAVVTKEDAEAFFSITPENCQPDSLPPEVADAAGQSVGGSGRKGQGAAVVSLAKLEAIFQGRNQRAIPRRQLILELMRQGVRQSTAYDTLGKRSHLRNFMEDQGGLISLKSLKSYDPARTTEPSIQEDHFECGPACDLPQPPVNQVPIGEPVESGLPRENGAVLGEPKALK